MSDNPSERPKLYARRKPAELGEHLQRHLDAVFFEDLSRPPAIAAELAWRDQQIARLTAVIDFIGTSDSGGELFPVGPSDREYGPDGNTLLRYVGPWHFLRGTGATFLEAVEAEMDLAAKDERARDERTKA